MWNSFPQQDYWKDFRLLPNWASNLLGLWNFPVARITINYIGRVFLDSSIHPHSSRGETPHPPAIGLEWQILGLFVCLFYYAVIPGFWIIQCSSDSQCSLMITCPKMKPYTCYFGVSLWEGKRVLGASVWNILKRDKCYGATTKKQDHTTGNVRGFKYDV